MKDLETLEAMFKGSLKNGIPLTAMLLALHNVCAHGENFGDGGPVDDDALSQLFDGFKTSIAAAKIMEGC